MLQRIVEISHNSERMVVDENCERDKKIVSYLGKALVLLVLPVFEIHDAQCAFNVFVKGARMKI